MKRLILLLFLALNIHNSCSASASQELFVQAAELYKENKFAQAQELYEKISDKSSRVYYNLGNCFYKQKKYGHALLNWRKAENNWGFFNRSELLRNIALVKEVSSQNLGTKQEKQEQSPITNFVLGMKNLTASTVSFIRSIPLLFLQIIFLILWFVMFVLMRFLYRKKQRVIIVSLFVFLVVSGSGLALKYGINARHYGVVLNKSSLMSGPGQGYQILGELSEAQEVMIQKKSGDYCKIKIYNQIGWVACKNIGLI